MTLQFLNDFWTPALVNAFAPVLDAQHRGREAILSAFNTIPDQAKIDLASVLAAGRVNMLATSAFIVPVLSAEFCAQIVGVADTYQWEENTEGEAEAYRMKEAVLRNVDPLMEDAVRKVLMTALSPWLLMIWGRLPSTISTIQLARYDADDRAEGAFHVDRDSAYSAVISLNPDEYEGGGLDIRDGLIGTCHVPKLPAGHAIIFDGQRAIHKGAAVTSGTKKILTLWANHANDIW